MLDVPIRVVSEIKKHKYTWSWFSCSGKPVTSCGSGEKEIPRLDWVKGWEGREMMRFKRDKAGDSEFRTVVVSEKIEI